MVYSKKNCKTFQKRKKHVFVKSVEKIFEFQKSNSIKIPHIYRLILCENSKLVALQTKKLIFTTQHAQNRICGLASPWVGTGPKSIWLRSCNMGSNSSIVSNPESLTWPYFTFAQFYRVTSLKMRHFELLSNTVSSLSILVHRK